VTFEVINGIRFHRQDLGAKAPVDAVPLVMLHGLLTGSLASWYLTCAPALARGRRVMLYDQRGHGQTEVTQNGYGSHEQATDLDAITADLAPFALVGHSFGALVAARFAAARPERVRALVLVEPPLGHRLPAPIDGVADVDEWLNAAGADLASLPRRQGERIRRLLDSTDLRTELAAEPPFTDDDIARLPRPLLVALGRRSPLAGVAASVKAAVPDAHVVLLDGGHALQVDACEELTELLTRFLASIDSPSVAYG
jgi:pimeloyl-ACP methyl ester carboxylesterase